MKLGKSISNVIFVADISLWSRDFAIHDMQKTKNKMIFWILKAKYLQINKCFIIFAFENQLALYGLAGLADEFCKRGDSLKTYW